MSGYLTDVTKGTGKVRERDGRQGAAVEDRKMSVMGWVVAILTMGWWLLWADARTKRRGSAESASVTHGNDGR